MITSTREKDFEAKAELGDTTTTNNNNSKLTKAPSSSRQWSAFRNPRIVRVSRAFGGKDRHSKVCTVRGLRDRRIRLSVPTAIQLYDLQERLGLSQPSKVVDWLMDATKNDIDKLPPLQMPPGNFSQFYPPTLNSHDLNSPQSSLSPFFNPNPTYTKGGIKINNNVGDDELPMMGRSKGWEFGGKFKEVVERENSGIVEKTKWNSMRTNEQENQDGSGGGNYIPQVSAAQNLFPMASNSNSFPSFLNNNSMPYNYFPWDPNSNLSLSQFPSQTESANAGNLMSIQSSMAFPSGSQLFLSPPLATPSMIFPPLPPYVATLGDQSDHTRQINHFPFLSSNSHHILSNPLMSSLHSFSSPLSTSTSKVDIHSPNDERQPNKGTTRGS